MACNGLLSGLLDSLPEFPAAFSSHGAADVSDLGPRARSGKAILPVCLGGGGEMSVEMSGNPWGWWK